MNTTEETQLSTTLLELLATNSVERIVVLAKQHSSKELSFALSRLSSEQQSQLLSILPVEEAATILDILATPLIPDVLHELSPQKAARILEEVQSDDEIDILTSLEQSDQEAILAQLPKKRAKELRELSSYPEYSAGGLMRIEYLSFKKNMKVGELTSNIRENRDSYSSYPVQYMYVTNQRGKLEGVLRLRDVLMNEDHISLEKLTLKNPISCLADATLDVTREVFRSHNFFAIPVVNNAGQLLGILHREDINEATNKKSNEAYLKSQGIIGGEEIRAMPTLERSSKRMSWLSINIFLNLLSASVIALYQDVLASVIALAVFLPIISDMSGCSGNQAVAVSIRELTLGLIKPFELTRVLMKEISVGLINGSVLGVFVAGIAWLWKGEPLLGVVVGSALAINTVIAVSIGGAVPLLLKRFKFDPALASGPILTTLTDFCGFFLTLSIAQHFLVAT